MAGGKLTPRQKMINLMYLVFIAMLALNMSKEVLSAFGILNNKIEESNTITKVRNDASYQQLVQKASEQPLQYGEKKTKVEKIRKLSADFNKYIEDFKTEFTSKLERDANGNLPFEAMDQSSQIDEKWFQAETTSKSGKEFLDRIANYVAQLKSIGGSAITADEMKKIENRFSTKPVFSKTENKEIQWLDYNYKGFPLIASITKRKKVVVGQAITITCFSLLRVH